jgi:hypothetical protein
VPRRPDNRPVKIGRLSACAALLLAACGSSPAKPGPSAAPSMEKPKPVMVYRNTPRPPALELPFIRVLGERDATLRWPKADLRLDLIGAAPAVDPLIGTPAPTPAEGDDEFVVAHVAAATEIADGVIKIAGKPHPVPAFARDSFIVVRAPRDAVVRLEVTDTGRMQWIDLRTAETGNLIQGYYPKRRDGASISCKVHSPAKPVDGSTLVLMSEANLEPWIDTRGWAPSGRLWLVVELRIWYSRNEIGGTFDGPATFDLSTPQGPIPATGTIVLAHNDEMAAVNGKLIVTADVPADLAVAQLAFHPKGTLTAQGAAVPQWSTTCQSVQDALTFT